MRNTAMRTYWICIGLSVLFCLLLPACATQPSTAHSSQDPLFQHALFGERPKQVETSDVFTASPAMLKYVQVDLASDIQRLGRTQALFEALFTRAKLKLDYHAVKTGTASETFVSRQGNCLSLVIMTAALADALDLPTTIFNVMVAEQWSRQGDMYLASGHVNIMLGRFTPRDAVTHKTSALIVDFAPIEAAKITDVQRLSRKRIVAMYANNRAAESLLLGQLSLAYWWSRAAIETDASFDDALNTIAVVFRRAGNLGLAEMAFLRARQKNPKSVHTLSNLQILMRDLGRNDEAQQFAVELKKLQPVPLNVDYRKALERFAQHDFSAARDLLLKELKRQPTCAECRFQLARAYLGLKDNRRALDQLRQALTLSADIESRKRYVNKLTLLKSM